MSIQCLLSSIVNKQYLSLLLTRIVGDSYGDIVISCCYGFSLYRFNIWSITFYFWSWYLAKALRIRLPCIPRISISYIIVLSYTAKFNLFFNLVRSLRIVTHLISNGFSNCFLIWNSMGTVFQMNFKYLIFTIVIVISKAFFRIIRWY